jgi:Family of unknown function (DUF6152)
MATRLVLVAWGVLTPVSAHHSYAQYDRCENLTIEGDIERITWSNPHTLVWVKTREGAFLIEWFPLSQLERAGITSGVLKVGEHVLFTGSRNRTPGLKVLSLITAVRRPADGWQWSRPFPVNPPAPCGK